MGAPVARRTLLRAGAAGIGAAGAVAAAAALQRFAAERFGKSLLALAIRWILDQGPTIALWGARRPDQSAGLDDAFGWRLGTQDLEAIDGSPSISRTPWDLSSWRRRQ